MERLIDLARKTFWAGIVAVVAYLGENGKDGGFVKDVWASLKTASPPVAMLLFLLLLDERRERREAQRQCNERTEAFTESTNGTANVLQRFTDALRDVADGVNGKSPAPRPPRRRR